MPSEFTGAWQARGHVAARVRPLDSIDLGIIARHSAKRTNGVIASLKNGTPMRWRRLAERDLMLLLEVDADVVGYHSLPERVEYVLDGKPRRHVPAVGVHTDHGPLVMDVFPDTGEHAPWYRVLAEVVRAIYARRGVRYAVLTPAEVRLEPRFGNALHVLDHRALRPGQGDQLRVVEALTRRGGSATVAELRGMLGDGAEAVFPMALRRALSLDLSAPEPSRIRAFLRAGGLT
ncbi:hypothetical protein [Belnapia rosea]|uniref:TnsA endonuclease N terminal n=1 Tax=Belnapia rosea TaxID=938405 RepID=A0A1G7BZW6_9PROT|nr:hypothetical protein [Belnapia rosea]SDE32611.1 hypothetical protein SAMN04487779_102831 [Belnapia rosea]